MRIFGIVFFFACSLYLDFIHFSPLGAWAICPAASEFYLGGFKNPPAQNSLYCRANIQRRAAPINGQSPVHAEFSIQTLAQTPRVFLIPDFLSAAECDHIIEAARPYLERSTVVDESKPNGGVVDWRRSSQGMFFPSNPRDPILRRVEQRIAALTCIPIENGEAIQVLSYQVGGEYQPHYDYFYPSTPGGASHLDRGGQRVATVIMYLNTPKAGGETIFPSAKLSVAPRKGTALLFYNCTPSGEVDPLTLHGGAPVKAGEKWIATKWLRKNVFH